MSENKLTPEQLIEIIDEEKPLIEQLRLIMKTQEVLGRVALEESATVKYEENAIYE